MKEYTFVTLQLEVFFIFKTLFTASLPEGFLFNLALGETTRTRGVQYKPQFFLLMVGLFWFTCLTFMIVSL